MKELISKKRDLKISFFATYLCIYLIVLSILLTLVIKLFVKLSIFLIPFWLLLLAMSISSGNILVNRKSDKLDAYLLN